MVNNPGDCFVLGKLKYIKSMKKPREIRMRVEESWSQIVTCRGRFNLCRINKINV
jgi:hypothetical protein